MNLKVFLILSLFANVGLGLYAFRKPAAPPPDTTAASTSASGATTATAPAKAVAKAKTPGGRETVTNTLIKKFTWESVEAPDYKEYIANLRSVGCPEETIRDIITADVNKLYDAKKKALRGTPKKFEFWKGGNPFMAAMGDSEMMEKMKALDDERNGVLRALGIEPDFKSAVAQMVNPLEAMFDFVPEGKRNQLMKLMSDMQTKMAKSMKDGGQPDPAEIGKAQKEMEMAVKAMLTPEEAMDYDLRMSMTANIMRTQIAGFDPNEEEFLSVFKLRKSFDDQFSPMSRGNETEDERKKREEAEKQLKEQVKQTLGEARYKDYELGQDYVFQQMFRAAKRAELGAAEAKQAYDMKKTAESQATKIRTDESLSQEQKTAALQAIRQETESSMARALGKGWDNYNRPNNMYWLNNIYSEKPKSTK
jgi:hypothetical protein